MRGEKPETWTAGGKLCNLFYYCWQNVGNMGGREPLNLSYTYIQMYVHVYVSVYLTSVKLGNGSTWDWEESETSLWLLQVLTHPVEE